MLNKIVLLSLFVGIFILMSFGADRQQKKKRVVFFGDSITEMGVQADGYITKMKAMLAQQGIDNYDLIGAGIGGNKIYDLYLRMDEDVINQSPDIVVIFEGVNDVWHKTSMGTGTDADKYEKFYRAVIKKLQADNIKVMLVTPLCIGEHKDETNQQDGDLNKYCNIIKRIGNDLHLPVCDLRSFFTSYETNNNPANADKGILTRDGVHFNDNGASQAAEQIWNVLKGM
jgi:lysophospholipase L1-like esterase